MGAKKEKINITFRCSERIFLRLKREADEKDIGVGTYVRSIVEEHYEINQRRTIKEITKQAERLLPDFKKQQKSLIELTDKMEEYIEQSMITEDYVSEMKSAESFNMKESREMFEEIHMRIKALEKSALGSNQKTEVEQRREDRRDSIAKRLDKRSDSKSDSDLEDEEEQTSEQKAAKIYKKLMGED